MEMGGGGAERQKTTEIEKYTLCLFGSLWPHLPMPTYSPSVYPWTPATFLRIPHITRVSIILVTGPNQASDHQCPQFNK